MLAEFNHLKTKNYEDIIKDTVSRSDVHCTQKKCLLYIIKVLITSVNKVCAVRTGSKMYQMFLINFLVVITC